MVPRLSPSNVTFFLCDIQEKLIPTISEASKLISVAQRMLKVAESLQIPVITTEQYPKGLGKTVAEFNVPGPVFEKTQFSMLTPQVRSVLNPKHSIVLFGMETHVCVYQTVKDLLDANYNVFLVADGISSRFPEDKKYALEQMRQWNVTVSTSESIIFELLKDSQHPQFKAMSALIKDRKE